MYYFIVNPNAKCGRGNIIWKKLQKALDRDSVEYEAHITQKPGDATFYARDLTEGCKAARIIVIVGGDGTINEVLNGLFFSAPVTLGYVPAGSGNDLARSLKLSKNPLRCLKKILHPKYHKLLDYGVLTYGEDEISCRRFMVSAGIGMDAAVCHNLLYSRSPRLLNRIGLGKLKYLLAGIKQLILAKPTKGYLLLDGVKKVEFCNIYFISIHIHPYEGGGFQFAPGAKCDDGKLQICVMNSSSKRKLIPSMLNALSIRPGHSVIRSYECSEVVIHTERPMPVHVDGESCFCQRDIEIQCITKKLRMII